MVRCCTLKLCASLCASQFAVLGFYHLRRLSDLIVSAAVVCVPPCCFNKVLSLSRKRTSLCRQPTLAFVPVSSSDLNWGDVLCMLDSELAQWQHIKQCVPYHMGAVRLKYRWQLLIYPWHVSHSVTPVTPVLVSLPVNQTQTRICRIQPDETKKAFLMFL